MCAFVDSLSQSVWAALTNFHRLGVEGGAYKLWKFLSHSSEAWKSKIKPSADLVSGESHLLPVSSHKAERRRGPTWASFIRALIPFRGLHPHDFV